MVKIKVDVKAVQKKGSNEVRNRLTYIDEDTNDVVASYSQIGEQGSGLISENEHGSLGAELNKAVIGLDYQLLPNQEYVNGDTLHTFNDKDKTWNGYVEQISSEPLTWGQAAARLVYQWPS